MFKDFIEEKRQKAKAKKWQNFPQYWNGTIITGRLSDVGQATGARVSSTNKLEAQGSTAPFLPPEIVREIIFYATDTFPAPSSIHHPSPNEGASTPQPPFPYSSCEYREDTETDRKLHALSMKVKTSVSRVSKMWRDVSTEFLYNSVRIHNSKQIPLLWKAFEINAVRRGEEVKKGATAEPGAAAWWIRELWVDLDQYQHIVPTDSEKALPAFDLADLLRMCPNIVVYRGFGRWKEFQFQALLKHGAVLKQILGLPEGEGSGEKGKIQDSESTELVIPDDGRRIELNMLFDFDPFLPLFQGRSLFPSTPLNITIPSISSLELRSIALPRFTTSVDGVTIRLPNLTHLSIWGVDSLKYAAAKLQLPALKSLTYNRGESNPLSIDQEPRLERFLEVHGHTLEELAVLDKTCARNFVKLDQLCPILDTLRVHYQELPSSPVPSVQTVGLYGLEHAVHETGLNTAFGEGLVSLILTTFTGVTTIQDMSWRSGVIRQRAFTNWRDPEGVRYREFWSQFLNAAKKGSTTCKSVEFLDWRGRLVDEVPGSPPKDQNVALDPDERLMDALVSRTRI